MQQYVSWICDQCGKSFNNETECQLHELSHIKIKNVLDYTGLLTVKAKEGWDVRYIGDIPLQDLLDRMLGRIVRIHVLGGEKDIHR